ncbi:unnamed protein product, partial [Effrenium voratum]
MRDALVTLFSSDQRLESPKATVPEELLEMWARLLADSSTADLRICISGSTGEVSELNAHSVVLRAASPVLNAMLSGCMQEASGRVSVENVSLAAAKVLLSLMYTGSLPLDLDAQSTVVLEAMCLAHRWQVQYVVHILVSAAEKALTPETFEPTADCAIRLQLPELLAICRSFANARK